MSDLHIDDFCRDVALALAHLYLAFPRKQILYVEDLLGPVETDEFGLPTTRFQACFSALVWLGEEGWLRFDAPVRQEALDQAVLTQRAFLLLSAAAEPGAAASQRGAGHDTALPPSVAAAESSRIARLRRALRQGSSIELGNAVRELLGAAR